MNGQKDQITALRFIQSHIANFGGDPTKVGARHAGRLRYRVVKPGLWVRRSLCLAARLARSRSAH